jgi:hypothetical protein
MSRAVLDKLQTARQESGCAQQKKQRKESLGFFSALFSVSSVASCSTSSLRSGMAI